MDLDGLPHKKQKGKKKKEVDKISKDTSRIGNAYNCSMQKQQIISDRVLEVLEKLSTLIIKITNKDAEQEKIPFIVQIDLEEESKGTIIKGMRKHSEIDITEGPLARENQNETTSNAKVVSPSNTAQKRDMDQNKEILSKIREIDTGAEESGMLQVRASEMSEILDLGEAENFLLFSSPKTRMEDNPPKAERKDPQQQDPDKNVEAELSTPRSKRSRVASKFWQTPNDHITSPFTPVLNQPDVWDKDRNIEGSIVKDVQNFLNKELNSPLEEE